MGNLLPLAGLRVVYTDSNLLRVSAWVVICGLEPDSLKAHILSKFNHHPRLFGVCNIPFIPLLLTRAKKVLRKLLTGRTTVKNRILRCYFCGTMQEVPLTPSKLPLNLNRLLMSAHRLLIA